MNRLKLLLVGDVMLGRMVNQMLKRASASYPWGDTKPLFEAADWRICNLECVISDRGAPWGTTPKAFHFSFGCEEYRLAQGGANRYDRAGQQSYAGLRV